MLSPVPGIFPTSLRACDGSPIALVFPLIHGSKVPYLKLAELPKEVEFSFLAPPRLSNNFYISIVRVACPFLGFPRSDEVALDGKVEISRSWVPAVPCFSIPRSKVRTGLWGCP